MNTPHNNQQTRTPRHPIVVVLGHIDHGKTTLLDTIRKTNVVEKESGGITQHLGAYEVAWHDKKITFLDTPGHETFSKMRARGARVADIAVLVVAADDGVKPQTKEAYEAIRDAKIPFVVALNKIDKATADHDRAKAQLAEIGVLVEGWGGSVPVVAISAKEGKHIDELLETVLLLAELENLTGDASALASGVVIESHLDARRGPSALLLVRDGTLAKGQFVLAGRAWAPVRILETSGGEATESASPSSPARVVGFSQAPAVGAEFQAFATKKEIEERLTKSVSTQKTESASTEVAVLIKADVAGSLEALGDEAKKVIPPELAVKFFDGGVGDIGENDVKNLSSAKKAFIIGFNVKVKDAATDLAARYGMTVATFSVIYEALDWLKKELTALVPKKLVREDFGKLIVLKVFRSTPGGRVVGGRVREGKVPRDARFEIIRGQDVVGRGSVRELQRNKAKAEVLREGEEGGLLVESSKAIEERDTLAFFYEREA